MAERLLTPEEVAERLRVSPVTVRVWLRRGLLSASKIGALWRISEEQLQAFLQPVSKGE